MIKEKAYAKINLYLNIVDKRDDDYHDLEMVMASINLFDVVSFKQLSTPDIIINTDQFITNNPEDNLVYKIAKHLQEVFSLEHGVEITIEKNIPIAAGLAGGSADAAATLRGLNKLWKLKLSLEELAEIGLEFGSDIPFCIYNKLCIARGRGEELVFLEDKLNFPVIIINPNIPISTKEVFNKVIKENIKEHKIGNMTSGIYNKNLPLVAQELYNSLEGIVFKMNPKVEEIKNQMLSWGIEGALMSGSGATVFGLSEHKNKLKEVFETFSDDYFKTITKIR